VREDRGGRQPGRGLGHKEGLLFAAAAEQPLARRKIQGEEGKEGAGAIGSEYDGARESKGEEPQGDEQVHSAPEVIGLHPSTCQWVSFGYWKVSFGKI